MIEVALVCVGQQYDPSVYVRNIQLGLRNHLRLNHRITVLTDTPNHPFYIQNNIRTVPTPNWGSNFSNHHQAWWYKMYLFSQWMEFKDVVFYLDLDTVLIKDCVKFIHYEKQGIGVLQDFNRRWMADWSVYNTSVMRYQPWNFYEMYNVFASDKERWCKRFRGDQDFVTWYLKDTGQEHFMWPHNWGMSFKWEIYRGGLVDAGTGLTRSGGFPLPDKSSYMNIYEEYVVPEDCSIVVFHGAPKPYSDRWGSDLAPYIKQLGTEPV